MPLDAGNPGAVGPKTMREEVLSRLDAKAGVLFEAALDAHCMPEQELAAMIDWCASHATAEHPCYILMLIEFVRKDVIEQSAVEAYMLGQRSPQKLFERDEKMPAQDTSINFPQIPGFHFLEKLGQGGQGTVYLAEQDQGILKRKVAVKIFKDSTGQHFARMKREVNAPASLPSSITGKIVITYDAQPLPDGSGYFSVMEYVEGGESLRAVESGEKPPLSSEEVWDIAQNILETLQAFEEQGVAHRDIKPANILVAGSTVKLADFGLVKTEGHGESFATEEGTILGTMAYLDPDNAKDARFDVYSLGMTVRCLLTGSLPFSDEGKNVSHLLNAHRSFSHRMEEFSASRKNGGRSRTISASPEWVPELKQPRTQYEKALAYLAERASLPINKRPMPSALLEELSERFPDLMGDMKSRKRVDSIRQRSRTSMRNVVAGLAVTAAAAGALALAVMNMGKDGSKEKEGSSGRKQEIMKNDPLMKPEKIETAPPKPQKKFEEMTDTEKKEFIEQIARNATGSPKIVDKENFVIQGMDELPVGIRTSAHIKDKNMQAGVFYFPEDMENDIQSHFGSYGLTLPDYQGSKRYGIWYRFFDENGKDQGLFWHVIFIGTGAYFPPKTEGGEGRSVFYPCLDAKDTKGTLVGVHDLDLQKLIAGKTLPPRQSFLLPKGAHEKIHADARYDYCKLLEINFKAFQEHSAQK